MPSSFLGAERFLHCRHSVLPLVALYSHFLQWAGHAVNNGPTHNVSPRRGSVTLYLLQQLDDLEYTTSTHSLIHKTHRFKNIFNGPRLSLVMSYTWISFVCLWLISWWTLFEYFVINSISNLWCFQYVLLLSTYFIYLLLLLVRITRHKVLINIYMYTYVPSHDRKHKLHRF